MSLEFLSQASNEDLKFLCDMVIKDRQGHYRPTEELSQTSEYRHFYPNRMHQLLPYVIEELRLYGGNSIVNFFRGVGPEYREILRDVADFLKVYYSSLSRDEEIEQRILEKIELDWRVSFNDSTLKQKSFIAYLPIAVEQFIKAITGRSIPGVMSMSIPIFLASRINPFGLIASGLLLILQASKPTYKVTVPAVVYISYLRYKYEYGYYRPAIKQKSNIRE